MVINERVLIVRQDPLSLEASRLRTISTVGEGCGESLFASCSLGSECEDVYLCWSADAFLLKGWFTPTKVLSQSFRSDGIQLTWTDPE